MDSHCGSCIYCIALNDNSNYIDCTYKHLCCHDCDSCTGRTFMWDTLRKFITHAHGGDYVVNLEKKIETYLSSLINNCPLPDTYLDEDRSLGCHIKNYIDEFTFSLHYDFPSIIVNNNLADETVRSILKHYQNIYRYNGIKFDISIECIKMRKLDYLAHYYKNIVQDINKNALVSSTPSIIRFITTSLEFNTPDNILKLHEIYGKESFDKEMTRMLSNVLNHNRLISLDTLPPSISSPDTLPPSISSLKTEVLNSSFNKLQSLNTLPPFISSLKTQINFDKNDLDWVKDNSSEFNAFKTYYQNYIQDENILDSLLIDNVHIHNIYDENPGIFADIKTAILN